MTVSKFPLWVTFVFVAIVAWMWATDNVMRSASVMVLVPLWVLFVGLWWVFKGQRGARLSRLGWFVLLLLAALALLRYDGSADGSAFPTLAFRWQKTAAEAPAALAVPTQAATLEDETAPAGAADMPRFLGALGDGVLPEPPWSTDWKAHPPREVWRQSVGLGWSGAAVVGRRVVTQEQRGEQECVTCYDLVTGKLLWSHADTALFTEGMGGDGPRATPTVDVTAGLVYALGGTGLLNCLDLKTGAVKWMRDVLKEAGSPPQLTWGKSASPLLVGSLVVCSGGDNGVSLLAFDRTTGAPAWQAGTDGGSYSSPVLMTLGGKEQIVSLNRQSITAHEPQTGRVLWSFDWPGTFPKVCQPVAAGPDRVLVTASYSMKSFLLEIKASADGTFTCQEVWSSRLPRTKFSSASIFGAHAYALDEGTLACVDLANGERIWRDGRYGFGQQVSVGGRWLLLQVEKGPVVLIQPSPEGLKEIGRVEALSSKTWNPPTLAGRWLLVRNDREMVCYELPAK